MNGWNKLPKGVVEMGPVRELKEGLNNVWLPVFEDDDI